MNIFIYVLHAVHSGETYQTNAPAKASKQSAKFNENYHNIHEDVDALNVSGVYAF